MSFSFSSPPRPCAGTSVVFPENPGLLRFEGGVLALSWGANEMVLQQRPLWAVTFPSHSRAHSHRLVSPLRKESYGARPEMVWRGKNSEKTMRLSLKLSMLATGEIGEVTAVIGPVRNGADISLFLSSSSALSIC